MSTDPVIHDALAREVPLRTAISPAWDDVLTRAEQLRSSAWRVRRRRSVTSRWALVGALVASAGLSIGGLAIAGAFGPLHGARLVINPSTVGGTSGGIASCDLIGKRADQVAAKLTSAGVGIEWRFMHWGTTVASTGNGSPTAITGGTSDAVPSVPNDSVVWDVVPDGQAKAFVFVQAPNDPNAPTISSGNCTS
jgi:hypothetical protein